MTSAACLQQGARARRERERACPCPALFGSAVRGCETPPNEEGRAVSSRSGPRPPNPHHDRALQQAAGLVQGPVLEGGDGADAGRPAVLRENHLRQRDCVGSVQRGHDPHGRLQHAQDHQGERHHQAVGHRRPAALQEHVGALLSRRQRYSVHGGRGRPREDRGLQERATQPAGQTTAAGHPRAGAGKQAGPSRSAGREGAHRENEPVGHPRQRDLLLLHLL